MKKQLSYLLQYLLIVLFVGYGYFGVMMFKYPKALLIWPDYKKFFINWIVAFSILAFIRSAIISLTNYQSSTLNPNNSHLKSEIWVTFQYLVIALISIIGSFQIYIFLRNNVINNENLSFNYVELWQGFKPIFLTWLIGFLVVSLIRLGFIYMRWFNFSREKTLGKMRG
jgi:hypothetical protein